MNKSLVKSTYTVASMTMISRIFGFIRDMVIAQIFGAGAALDAFSVAFKIPNVMRQLFAEGAFSQTFIPVLAEYQKRAAKLEMQRFVNATAGTLSLILGVITIIGIVFAPWIIKMVAPGFGEGTPRYECAVIVLRITFPYLILISLTAFAGAILNTFNLFWVAAFTPIFLNVSMIVMAIYLTPYLHIPITALAWAVLFAGIIQLYFQLYFVKPLHLLSRPCIDFRNVGVTKVLRLMLPALFGVSIAQINLLVDTFFASFLAIGSVSWLYFSDRLIDVPLGVFGVAISTVILPHLSRCHAGQANESFSKILDWALRCMLLVGLPATIIFAILSGPLLSTLFQHGKFDGYAVIMARKSLIAFALGIIPFMITKILVTGFFAKQDMRTPVRIGIFVVIFNIALNSTLIWPLAHTGIALSTSVAALFNVSFLLYFLRRLNFYQPQAGWKLFSFQLLFANIILTLWLWLRIDDTQLWLSHHVLWRSMHLLMLLLPGALIYFMGLWLTGMRLRSILIPKHDDPDDDFKNESDIVENPAISF